MVEFAKSYDRESALRFPLMPGAHKTAWNYIFDWAIAGEALQCAPGDLILEFGSGPAYASEWLNRMGYHTVALDLEPSVLNFAHQRIALDQRTTPSWAHYVAGDGMRLPFADAMFDGLICLNALHHMPDYVAALSEMRRVLKPGGRAAFSEPGNRHAESPESRFAIEQFGAVERNIVLEEIYRISQQVGFEQMLIKPYVSPMLVNLDYRRFKRYRRNLPAMPYAYPHQIAQFVESTHALFVLKVPGEKLRTSASPGLLRAQIEMEDLPHVMHPGQEVHIRAQVQNTGDTLWLSAPREIGGYVTWGVKLCNRENRVLSDTLGRTLLSYDVPPGGQIVIRTSFQLPPALPTGEYVLLFDLVAEHITWFEACGSLSVRQPFSLVAEEAPGADDVVASSSTLPTASASAVSGVDMLIELTGQAIADMGVVAPGDDLIAPITEIIEDLQNSG